MWEQWDTVVFPKEFRHGVRDVQSGYEIVSLFQAVSEGSENTDRQIENRELVVARCLGVYLHSYQIKLQTCDIVSASFGISQMLCNVEQVFNQLKYRLIGHESRTGDRIFYAYKNWSSQKLNSVRTFSIIITLCTYINFTQVIENWAMSIVRTLTVDESTDARYTNGSCLVSAITVLCILFRTVTLSQLSEENCTAMACLLRKSYKPKHKTCPAYAALDKHLPTTEFRYKLLPVHVNLFSIIIIEIKLSSLQ